MSYSSKMAGLVLIAGLVIGTALVATPVVADKSSASNGLEIADLKIHENTGLEQDIRFHEGTCQGGHTTTVLQGLGGCNPPPTGLITDPGNSDLHRQDSR
jgi:hypothetical protein